LINNLDEKLVEILSIISEHDEPIGAKLIARELKRRGYEIGERAVRYHLQLLDEKNLTKKFGYSGRAITEKGLEELEKANISYRIGSVFSQIMEKLYLSNFPTKVIINKTVFEGDYENIRDSILNVMNAGFSIGDYVNIIRDAENPNLVNVETLCSITFDNFLLKNGILSMPKYGGIVKFEDYEPVYFGGVIDFRKSSIDPLEAFISRGKTDVLGIIENGEGYLPANFRIIPSSTKEKFENLLKRDLLNGVLSYGEDNVLGLSLNEGEIGVALVGGLSPICPAVEMGYDVKINAATTLKDLSLIEKRSKKYLHPINKKGKVMITPVLSKMMSMMHSVSYDIESNRGNVLVNTGYIDKKYEDDVIDALKECYKSKTVISDRIGIEKDGNQIKINTLCSTTIDGIFLKYGIPIIPYYGGILELGKNRFIDIIAYGGTSLDPHEVFFNRVDGEKTILSGIRKAPMEARDNLIKIVEKLNWTGILNIGMPNNDLYGIKVEKGMFGFASIGGMNPFVLIKNKGIPVKIEALHDIKEYSKLIPLKEL
jgi:repressor of nif and glnA expression